MVVWSAAWSDSETAVPTWPLLAEKSKVLACNERNGITLTAVGLSATVLQELGPSYPYCWTVPVRKVDGEAPARVVVYRRTCCAPAEHDASLLIKIAVLVDIALEHDRLNSRLRHQANHDALTGLPNRQQFRNHLAEAIAAAEQSGGSLGLIYTDLDDFKMVNDAEGHLAGDELLSKVAARLKEQLGDQIMVARTSGDEFGILLRDIEGETDVTSLANRILKAMRTPFDMGGRDQFVSTTMGISLYPRDATTAGSLIRCADIALYRAKAEGKGRFQTYRPEMDQVARRRQLILNRLHHATVHPEEFAVVFQPQIELNTGRLSGMEALLRWEAPGLGQISPTEFVPIAEASGLILRIGEWILNEVCRYARQWKDQGGVLDRVAVNVSGLQFAQPNFIDTVSAVLRDTGLEPSSLELELTESVVMRSFADSAKKFAQLRGLGIAISIDDFGTGYSSLSYLEQLPVDTLKIDASFIRRIALGQATPLLVQAIVGLAHHLGLSVIAEGIETEYQMEILRKLGCDKGQGYWIGKPVAVESVFRTLLDPNCSRVGQRDQPTALIDTASSLLSLCEHTRAQPHEVCA
jgi:diguanylate cyclase (GGDEF)-like protein